MNEKKSPRSNAHGTRTLTRRNLLALGSGAAASLCLSSGLIRSASAQTVSFDYYIGPNGSDSNPGTLSQPWAITALNSKSATYAGKTIGMLDGTYNLIAIMGQPDATSGSSQRARLSVRGGSATSPTILKAVNARQAVINFNRAAQTTNSLEASLQPYGDYVTFDGLTFMGNNYQCIVNNSGSGKGGNNMTVQNCYFTDQDYLLGGSQNSAAIYTQGFNDIVVSNCYFDSCRASGDSNRFAIVQAFNPTARLTVEYCTVIGSTNGYRTNNFVFAKAGGVVDVTIRYNYYQAHDPKDFFFEDWGDSTTASFRNIHHNIFSRPGTSGDAIFLLRNGQGVKGTWNIYNNTFVASVTLGDTAGFEKLYLSQPVQLNFYNNVFHRLAGGSSWGDFDLPDLSRLGKFDFNLYDTGPATAFRYNSRASVVTGLRNWQAASGKDSNSIESLVSQFVATGTGPDYFRMLTGVLGKTLGEGGLEVGAWSGASRIGASFAGGVVLPAPKAPQITNIT